jgi:hypothetical protein
VAERFRSQREEYEAEPVDREWAPKATRAHDADLQRIAARSGFEVVDVGCATTLCVASLRWPSYPAAVDGHGEVLQAPYEMGSR